MTKLGTYQLPDGIELTDEQAGVWRETTFVPDQPVRVVELPQLRSSGVTGKIEKVLTVIRPYAGEFAEMEQPDVIVLDGIEYRPAEKDRPKPR